MIPSSPGSQHGCAGDPGLSVVLLRIWQEMSVQSEIMRQMLQVSMVQLDILRVGATTWCCKLKHYIRSGVGCGGEDSGGSVKVG